MEPLSWIVFAAAVFIGSYVQTVIGFAMGMIVVAIVGASAAFSLPTLTAAVSIISLVNIIVALKGHVADIERPVLKLLVAGQIPAIILGLWLLAVLDRDAQWILQLLLGVFVASGSLSVMMRPHPLARTSPSWAWIGAGIGGGLIGGLFSASGPVIGWFTYRQPLRLAVIRATMLGFFAVATAARTLIVGLQGGVTAEVLSLSALAAPVVVLGAWLGRVRPPRVSEAKLKRGVFWLLFALGVYIIAGAF
jgi:uncharacterized membrane protein YfcA